MLGTRRLCGQGLIVLYSTALHEEACRIHVTMPMYTTHARARVCVCVGCSVTPGLLARPAMQTQPLTPRRRPHSARTRGAGRGCGEGSERKGRETRPRVGDVQRGPRWSLLPVSGTLSHFVYGLEHPGRVSQDGKCALHLLCVVRVLLPPRETVSRLFEGGMR